MTFDNIEIMPIEVRYIDLNLDKKLKKNFI